MLAVDRICRSIRSVRKPRSPRIDRYWLFESRSFGAETRDPLPVLAARWLAETFGVDGARPCIAPPVAGPEADVAVSFGVGGNPAKRVADPFEEAALGLLARRGTLLIDKGAGGEEAGRVERAIARSGARVKTWDGAFAPFAAAIATSRFYAGYDSAGGHVASACGVPLVSVFAGYPCRRFVDRWSPNGAVILASTPGATIDALARALV